MAVASSPQDFAAAQSHKPTENWAHYCLKFVRTALGISGGSDTAYHAFLQAQQQGAVYTDKNPPPNVPVFWGPTSGNAAGHVALSAGNGYVWTTDMNGSGTVSLHKLDDVGKWAGGKYLGWSTKLNGKDIAVAPSNDKGGGFGALLHPSNYVNAVKDGTGAIVNGVGNVADKLNPLDGLASVVAGIGDWVKGGIVRVAFFVLGTMLLLLFALRASSG